MKVVAVNTSPDRERGVVSLLLDPFLDGLREAGAEVELFYTVDGFPSPGSTMAQAGVLILASPIFFDGRTGPEGATPSLKLLLERMASGAHMSTIEPVVHEIREEGVNPRRVVIVSGSGFWEISSPCPAPALVMALCQGTIPEWQDIGGVMLRGVLPRGLLDWDIIAAARETGCEMAREAVEPPIAHDLARRAAATRACYDQIMSKTASQRAASYAMPVMMECIQKDED